MDVFDTDTLTHFLHGRARVVERARQSSEEITITIVTQIEVLQGRFASVLKADDGEQLLLAYHRLVDSEKDLREFRILGVDEAATANFDRLRQDKKFKRIGRADLLIASITMANRAKLVTRNEGDFRRIPGLMIENWVD